MNTQTLNVSLNNVAQNLKLQNMLILAVSSSPNQLLVFKQSFFLIFRIQVSRHLGQQKQYSVVELRAKIVVYLLCIKLLNH